MAAPDAGLTASKFALSEFLPIPRVKCQKVCSGTLFIHGSR